MQLTQKLLYRELQVAATDARPQIDNNSDEIIMVDPNDVAIATAPKLDAHRNGLRHRAISIVIG
jgi:hypothetical protein